MQPLVCGRESNEQLCCKMAMYSYSKLYFENYKAAALGFRPNLTQSMLIQFNLGLNKVKNETSGQIRITSGHHYTPSTQKPKQPLKILVIPDVCYKQFFLSFQNPSFHQKIDKQGESNAIMDFKSDLEVTDPKMVHGRRFEEENSSEQNVHSNFTMSMLNFKSNKIQLD